MTQEHGKRWVRGSEWGKKCQMVGLSGFSLNAQLARRAGRTRICATQPYRFIIHRRRRWKIRDRLSEGEIAQIVQEFKAGTPKHVLAERAQ
jgi:hypothetical protein